jgi:hypothetical protein
VSLSSYLITKLALPLRGSKRRYSSVERIRRHIAEKPSTQIRR